MDVRNQRVKPLKRYTGSNLADAGRIAVHACRWWATPGPGEVAGREATRKVCGVLVVMLPEQSWAPTLLIATQGTWEPCRVCPSRCAASAPAGRVVVTPGVRQGAEPP